MFRNYWLESLDGGVNLDRVPESLREQAKEKAALMLIADPGVWIEGVGYRPLGMDWIKLIMVMLEE